VIKINCSLWNANIHLRKYSCYWSRQQAHLRVNEPGRINPTVSVVMALGEGWNWCAINIPSIDILRAHCRHVLVFHSQGNVIDWNCQIWLQYCSMVVDPSLISCLKYKEPTLDSFFVIHNIIFQFFCYELMSLIKEHFIMFSEIAELVAYVLMVWVTHVRFLPISSFSFSLFLAPYL
jgi:hypothetical protein